MAIADAAEDLDEGWQDVDEDDVRTSAPAASFMDQERKVRQPRNRSYALVGIAVLLMLCATVILGFFGFQGPHVFNQNPGWLIAFCIGALALGVLYLLFTLRSAMRHIREQSIAIVRLESRYRYFRPDPVPVVQPAVAAPAEMPNWAAAEPSPPAPRVSRPITTLQGIGPKFSRRLSRAGVKTLDDLRRTDEEKLEAVAKPLTPTAPHQWKAMADLMILNGVDAQAAELLVRFGCESINDLASREPTDLHRTLVRFNAAYGSRVYPNVLHLTEVHKWVRAARSGNRRDAGYPDAASSGMAMSA